jgi:hypothetical protein
VDGCWRKAVVVLRANDACAAARIAARKASSRISPSNSFTDSRSASSTISTNVFMTKLRMND